MAVIGSGPAGLAAADQLNQAGHEVTLFEKDAKVGGLLRYGIPDFKLEKWVIDRRIELMRQEGVILSTKTEIGTSIKADSILQNYDAVVLSTGAQQPRGLNIKGDKLKGVHFAMEFLGRQNQVIGGELEKTQFQQKENTLLSSVVGIQAVIALVPPIAMVLLRLPSWNCYPSLQSKEIPSIHGRNGL